MEWIVLAYSLPTEANTPRVTLWRRLQRLGAVSPTGSLYLLPAGEETRESFQWLAEEIGHAGGESFLLHVARLEGMSDEQMIALFNEARREEYEQLAEKLARLEGRLGDDSDSRLTLRAALEKLQRQYEEIRRIDYFQSSAGKVLGARLGEARQRAAGDDVREPEIVRLDKEDYRNRSWVTRPRPHVDRLACAWLIRRFIDPEAAIRYAKEPGPGELPFDMPSGRFSHRGNLCTFETMLRAFDLEQPGLQRLARLVHEIDLRDSRYRPLEAPGVDAVLRGWLAAGLSDQELEAHGLALFDGLYSALTTATPAEEES
ncbi:MAG TPA: chromate resistance protein ChrB domain-containing protein [Candidatus Sulfomarinibacteraceae bacterium]|nr:chromate resistance protein ChrB domain-containing protein [Candidatus Sulfomarinibacteraceae bacterium]